MTHHIFKPIIQPWLVPVWAISMYVFFVFLDICLFICGLYCSLQLNCKYFKEYLAAIKKCEGRCQYWLDFNIRYSIKIIKSNSKIFVFNCYQCSYQNAERSERAEVSLWEKLTVLLEIEKEFGKENSKKTYKNTKTKLRNKLTSNRSGKSNNQQLQSTQKEDDAPDENINLI